MTIYEYGTHIRDIVGEYKGVITGVLIRQDFVLYEITYFNPITGEKTTTWSNEAEFDVIEVQKRTAKKREIGFKNGEK